MSIDEFKDGDLVRKCVYLETPGNILHVDSVVGIRVVCRPSNKDGSPSKRRRLERVYYKHLVRCDKTGKTIESKRATILDP